MQLTRTTPRRRSRAVLAIGAAMIATATGVLAPTVASAEPGSPAEARALMQQAAQDPTIVDEQVHEAELTVAAQQQAAAEAAEVAAQAQAAVAVFEP